jgi:hypothetical protein
MANIITSQKIDISTWDILYTTLFSMEINETYLEAVGMDEAEVHRISNHLETERSKTSCNM